jgi:2'-5' RNA ligase
VRLFVAIELSDALKQALLEAQRNLRPFNPMVRWTKREQMHLTLKFLGEVPDARVKEICAALATAAQGAQALECSTSGAGCFPPRGRVRVTWVGLAGDGGKLAALQGRVEQALAPLGFPKEARPFAPHLTLGRVTEDSSGGRLRDALESLEVPRVAQGVDEFVLMQSQLLREGARYTRVGTWRLSKTLDA